MPAGECSYGSIDGRTPGNQQKSAATWQGKETADLSTTLRSGRDDKFVELLTAVLPTGYSRAFAATNLSSRPEESWACGPPKVKKNASVQQPLSIEPLPSPLSSRAKPRDLRFRGPLLEMFFDRVAMGLWPTGGDEKRLGPATTLYRTVALSFVIPSAAEGSAVPRTIPGNVFDRAQRSGGTCGSLCRHPNQTIDHVYTKTT